MRALVRVLTWAVVFSSVLATRPLSAQQPPAPVGLPAETRASIDKAVAEVLTTTGAPGASIAVVKDRTVAYLHAYGLARLDPKTPATTQMRYSIGSVSKQFTASAILLLAEEGRLSLDDKLVRYFPELTRANEVTIRGLLSMTSGYQDFWPQDYVMPMMLGPVAPLEILDRWARKPLDFEPGIKWQYSNTNYVIAGLIIEKIAGMPLVDFLRVRIFTPLRMTSVIDTDQAALGPEDPARYMRYALGPARPAPKEGRGWMFGAGELAMTAHDLALWDIAMIEESAMRPGSYRQLQAEVQLASGVGTRYGLGVSVGLTDGRRTISHDGEVSGFTARNIVFPDDGAAIVVFVNLDATNATELIAAKIRTALFSASDAGTDHAVAQAGAILERLARGRLDRSLFTSNANAYFNDQALADFSASLAPLGKAQEITQQSQSSRGGMVLRRLRARFAKTTLRLTTFTVPDGKIEQFMVAPAE